MCIRDSLYKFRAKIEEYFVTHDVIVVINNLTSEITELPWKPSVRLSAKMATKFKNVMNEDVRD